MAKGCAFEEIAKAAQAAEERAIAEILVSLAPRIHRLPYKINCDTPGHRLRGLCYRLWAEGMSEVFRYAREKWRIATPSDYKGIVIPPIE